MNTALAPVRLFSTPSEKGQPLQAVLALFAGVSRCARLAGHPLDNYPFLLTTLLKTGLSLERLSDLVRKGYLEQLPEDRREERGNRTLRPFGLLPRDARSAFVLTATGEAWVRRSLGSSLNLSNESDPSRRNELDARPSWCSHRRELTFRGTVVKRFRRPADNQFLVLESFEELDWPPEIDDPLPPAALLVPQDRLEETVKSLNRLLLQPLLRFANTPDRRGVCWKATRNT